MLTYSREQLIVLDRGELCVARDVRKSIFRLDLWTPRLLRAAEFQRRHDVNKRSADYTALPRPASSTRQHALRYRLLNAQSVGNKSTAICSIISQGRGDGPEAGTSGASEAARASCRLGSPGYYPLPGKFLKRLEILNAIMRFSA